MEVISKSNEPPDTLSPLIPADCRPWEQLPDVAARLLSQIISSSHRSASRGVVFVLGLTVSAVAAFAGDASSPSPTVQSRQLALITLAADADPKTSPLAEIWKDQLAALRAHVANGAIPFFDASFTDGDRVIVVSVSVDDPTCENYSGALARPTAYSSCPMRVAIVRGPRVSVVASDPHFGLPIPFDASGRFDTATSANVTRLGYDPSKRELTIAEVIDGKSATGQDDIPSTMHLKY
jgi:hypothetical protein